MNRAPLIVQDTIRIRYDRIITLTDAFAAEHLNAEYALLAGQGIAVLSKETTDPIRTGSPAVWGSSMIHALGRVNFLFDKGSRPHVSLKELLDWFGAGQSTVLDRSYKIRCMLKMKESQYEWTLPSRQNDLSTWLMSFTDDSSPKRAQK